MSQDKCPRCGTNQRDVKMQRIAASLTEGDNIHGKFYECGSYDILLNGFKQSDYCRCVVDLREMKARAEKAEAELAEAIEQRDKATAAMLAYEEAAQRTACAELRLAKREKALDESLFVIGAILAAYHLHFAGEEVERENAIAAGAEAVMQQAEAVPNLAGWIKSRSNS